jgi:hypothetical protein
VTFDALQNSLKSTSAENRNPKGKPKSWFFPSILFKVMSNEETAFTFKKHENEKKRKDLFT